MTTHPSHIAIGQMLTPSLAPWSLKWALYARQSFPLTLLDSGVNEYPAKVSERSCRNASVMRFYRLLSRQVKRYWNRMAYPWGREEGELNKWCSRWDCTYTSIFIFSFINSPCNVSQWNFWFNENLPQLLILYKVLVWWALLAGSKTLLLTTLRRQLKLVHLAINYDTGNQDTPATSSHMTNFW